MGMAWSNASKASNRKGQPYDISLPHYAWLRVTGTTQLQGAGRPPESLVGAIAASCTVLWSCCRRWSLLRSAGRRVWEEL